MNSKIAIIGFGSAGCRHHSMAKTANPDAEFLIVTRDSVAELSVAGTSKLGAVKEFEPDIVVLAGPASMRLETFFQLADNSRAFFFEKPLASSYRDAQKIMQRIGLLGSTGQVGYNLRFSESLRFFRDTVKTEPLGELLSVRVETGQFLPSWRPGSDYRQSVSSKSELGGGVLLELSHELDLIHWIFGEISWISAWMGKNSQLEIDVEDTAHITLGISPSNSSKLLVGSVSLDFFRHDRTRVVTAICERGSLRWDGIANVVKIHNADDRSWEVVWRSEATENSYLNQWKSFLHAIDSGATPEVTVEDGVKVLRAIDAIRCSHEGIGRRILLKDLVDDQ